jgi:hypothetical protein
MHQQGRSRFEVIPLSVAKCSLRPDRYPEGRLLGTEWHTYFDQ